MRDYIIEQLENFKRTTSQAFRLGFVNWGGTLTCLKIGDYLQDIECKLDRRALLNEAGEFDTKSLQKKRNELTPVQALGELEQILLDSLGFKELVELELLQMKVIYHNPLDSSQMVDKDREPALKILQQEYQQYDGFIGIHGTDTVSKTARFLNINLPHYDPKERWENKASIFNWTKPFPVVASQEPVARFKDGKFIPVIGSDGAMSMITALSILTSDRFGEVGCLIGREFVYRGTAYTKASESHLEFLAGDKGVPPLAERTAFGNAFPGVPFDERSMFQDRSPHVIHNSSSYEERVLTVRESSHLAIIKEYLKEASSGSSAIAEKMRDSLPLVILYESKGAGNVQKQEFQILEQFMELTNGEVYILRVPLPGGRVPREMHYNVPGSKISGCNIESLTAKYKAQAVLALMEQFSIKPENKKDFFYQMMETPFAREILPVH